MKNFIDSHYAAVTFLLVSIFISIIVLFFWLTGDGITAAVAGAAGALTSFVIQIALPALASAKITIVPDVGPNEQGRLCVQVRNCMDFPVIDCEILFEIVESVKFQGCDVLRKVISAPFVFTPCGKERYKRSIWLPIPDDVLPFLEEANVRVRAQAVYTNQMTGFRNAIPCELRFNERLAEP